MREFLYGVLLLGRDLIPPFNVIHTSKYHVWGYEGLIHVSKSHYGVCNIIVFVSFVPHLVFSKRDGAHNRFMFDAISP